MSINTPGKAEETQAGHSQTFPCVSDQAVSYHGEMGGSSWVTASQRKRWTWELGMGETLCKQQDRGMLRGGKAEDRGMENKNLCSSSTNTTENLQIGVLVPVWIFLILFSLFLIFFPSGICEYICRGGRKWRKGASQKVENRKRSQAREPR